MKKKTNIFMLMGTVLVFASLAAMAFVNISAAGKREKAAQTAEKIQQLLPPQTAGTQFMYSTSEMPVLNVDGTDCIALLAADKYSVCLPVQSRWSRQAVADTPCRFYGSCYDGSMVIGGNATQLEFVARLDLADEITVTDMLGAQFSYKVGKILRSPDATPEKLITEYPLTIFAPDKQGQGYIIVHCE